MTSTEYRVPSSEKTKAGRGISRTARSVFGSLVCRFTRNSELGTRNSDLTSTFVRLNARFWRRVPERLGYRAAEIIADVVYYGVWRQRRLNVLENMRHVLGADAPESLVRATARRSVRNYAKLVFEFLRFPEMTPAEIEHSVIYDNWALLGTPETWQHGWVIVGLHMGNWDLASACASVRSYPFNVIVDTFRPKALDDLVQGTRRSLGVKPIAFEHAARGVLRALRNREMLGILIDKPTPETGIPVRFFDGIVRVPAGAATLTIKTGARILPGALIRRPDNRFQLHLDDRFDFTPSGNLTQDVADLTQAIMASLERYVRAYPDQWFMFRRMWQTGA